MAAYTKKTLKTADLFAEIVTFKVKNIRHKTDTGVDVFKIWTHLLSLVFKLPVATYPFSLLISWPPTGVKSPKKNIIYLIRPSCTLKG